MTSPADSAGVPGPARTLAEARRVMTWREVPGRYLLVGFPGPPADADLALLRTEGHAQLAREPEGTTLLVPATADVAGVLARHPGAAVERDLVWIRFDAPLAWELVGFLAWVGSELARAGVPLGVVCTHARDHLFVPGRHRAAAGGVLTELFGPARGPVAR